MGSFDSLLDLQQLDTALTQLQYRRTHLPEQAQLIEVQRRLSALVIASAPATSARNELDRRQNVLEQQIHEIDSKIDAATKQLYGGTVTASRELQALEADIASLKRHRSELEDAELEVLMEREPVDAQMVTADRQRSELDESGDQSQAAIVEAIADIDREVGELKARRSTMADAIDTPIRESYERIRARNAGVGVAKLEHGTCMACRLKLSAVQLDQLKKIPNTEIAHCEECGAILVR